jgi:lipopolysaccharide export system protein LptC
MIDRRASNRFRLIVVLAVGAMLALGSFWVLEVMRRGITDTAPNAARSEPDYYVEKFNFVRMSQTGQAQYKISGLKLTHNPTDDSYSIQLPVVNSLSSDRPPMTTRAEQAVVDHEYTKVHMYRNVQIDRPATATTENFHLRSEYLLILPDDDVMQTDTYVEITLGKSKLTGIGMFANNATRELRVSNKVHARYQPPMPTQAR